MVTKKFTFFIMPLRRTVVRKNGTLAQYGTVTLLFLTHLSHLSRNAVIFNGTCMLIN